MSTQIRMSPFCFLFNNGSMYSDHECLQLIEILSFANANVLLVLGELMSQNNEGEDEGEAKRNAIPLMAAATLISQFFMCSSVSIGDYYTKQGVGRKILFLAGIITLPLRCALVILWRNSGPKMLLLTQIFDGIEGGLFRVIHPYIVVDLTFGTGRFNIVSKSSWTIYFFFGLSQIM